MSSEVRLAMLIQCLVFMYVVCSHLIPWTGPLLKLCNSNADLALIFVEQALG